MRFPIESAALTVEDSSEGCGTANCLLSGNNNREHPLEFLNSLTEFATDSELVLQ
jgi:hypothetical protein